MSLIERFFDKTVTILMFEGVEDGEPVYSLPEKRRCRIQFDESLNTSISRLQDSITLSAIMFCVGKPISERSIVKDGDETYTVTGCRKCYGFGLDHMEVNLV